MCLCFKLPKLFRRIHQQVQCGHKIVQVIEQRRTAYEGHIGIDDNN